MSLATTIKSIQDIMRRDVGVDGDAQRIGQLVWLLFLKIWDDRERELELIEDDFRSPLLDVTWQENGETRRAADLRWKTWASDPEGITGDGLLDFTDKTLFPALKGMEGGPKVDGDSATAQAARALRSRRLLLRSVFEDAYQYMKSGTLLRQVINRLQSDIDFNDNLSRHVFGEIYETILRGLQSAGNAGEYYTPRAVTQFAVDIVNPQLGEILLDPACGTGGFLASSIEHVRKAQVKRPEQEARLQASIKGVEKKPLPHLLCVTNMVVHGIDVPTGILHDNTLSRPLRDISAKDRVDVILTNPPFGGMEEDGIENNFPTVFRTRETADLFLVFIVEMLKLGGRAAIVLPDGTLFGEGVKTRIKEYLLTECDLHTIVRLPKGVFAPYTSIKTNVLFFTKGGPTKEVWYYEHPYPEGAKSYSKTKPMRIEEFEPEKAWWTDRRETQFAWMVNIEQIRERGFDLDIANPNAPPDTHEDPDALLVQFDKERAAAAALREELRKVLAAALSRGEGMTSQDLIAAFDSVAEAPGGVGRLRELVLQLAVRGKLVPQDPTDQPASALLKRIAAEKARRVKAGRIVKRPPLAQVVPDEQPFEIPESWAWARLNEIAHSLGQEIPERAFSYIDVGSIDNQRGVVAEELGIIEAADAPSRARKVVKPGTVIYSTIRPYLLNVAMIEQEYSPSAIASTAFAVLHPHAGIVGRLLFRWLRSPFFTRYVVDQMKGVAYPAINDASLLRAPLPVPPLAEQHRIVTRVDELMGLLDRLESARTTRDATRAATRDSMLDALREADTPDEVEVAWNRFAERMEDLLDDPADIAPLRQTILDLAVHGKLVPQDRNDEAVRLPPLRRFAAASGMDYGVFEQFRDSIVMPSGWEIAPLARLSEHIVDCPHTTPKWTNDGEICVRTNQLRPGSLDLSEPRYVSPETFLERIERLEPGADDILYSREGGILGIACRVPKGVRLCLGQRLMLIRARTEIGADFLEIVLNSPFITDIAKARTTGGAAPRVNMSTVRAYPIPVPPLAEQHRIVAKVGELLGLLDRLEVRLTSARTAHVSFAAAAVHHLDT